MKHIVLLTFFTCAISGLSYGSEHKSQPTKKTAMTEVQKSLTLLASLDFDDDDELEEPKTGTQPLTISKHQIKIKKPNIQQQQTLLTSAEKQIQEQKLIASSELEKERQLAPSEEMDKYLKNADDFNKTSKELLESFEIKMQSTEKTHDHNLEQFATLTGHIDAHRQTLTTLTSRIQTNEEVTHNQNSLVQQLQEQNQLSIGLLLLMHEIEKHHNTKKTETPKIAPGVTKAQLFISHIIMATGLLLCLWHIVKTNHLRYV